MESSSSTASTSRRGQMRVVLILATFAIILTAVVVFALTGRNNLGGGSAEQAPSGLVYRNTRHNLAFTMPSSWTRKEYNTEAIDFMGSAGCSVAVLSHFVLIPTSAYENSIEIAITHTHPGQRYTAYTLWQGSVPPDSAVHADLQESTGSMVSQNYIHFRRGVSIISLIETLPFPTASCQAQLAPIEKSFQLD